MGRFIVPLGFLLAIAISVTLWWNLPVLGEVGKQVKDGGFLVPALILLVILQTTFIIERTWSLKKAPRAAAIVPGQRPQASPLR